MINVRVGLPSSRTMSRQSKETFEALEKYSEIKFEVVVVSGTHCAHARNISSLADPKQLRGKIKQALPYDYYLSTDDDMAFRPENIERLVEENLDIVGASYSTREGPSDIIVAKPFGAKTQEDWLKVYDKGLKEVEWTGGGCILIKKNVFEAMEYPYWRNEVLIDGDEADLSTEDSGFCINARKIGFKVYCDLDNRVAHISR